MVFNIFISLFFFQTADVNIISSIIMLGVEIEPSTSLLNSSSTNQPCIRSFFCFVNLFFCGLRC